MGWFKNSNFRLTFYNLKPDTGLNSFSADEKSKIWTPKLLFANTENNLGYLKSLISAKTPKFIIRTLVDEEASITIEKIGKYKTPS